MHLFTFENYFFRRHIAIQSCNMSFRNKPMSNFDIMNWVKELKIKKFDGVFNKDSRQWASNCGIINLAITDQGHIGHVMLILFILIPLAYHRLKIFFLSNDIILYNIKKRYLFFVVTCVFFFY